MDHYILYPQCTKGAIHATSVAIHACVSKQLVTKGQFTLRFNVEFRIRYTLPKSKEKEQAE